MSAGAAAMLGSTAGCLSGDDGGQSLSIDEITEWPPDEYENEINHWNWYTNWRDELTEEFAEEFGIDNVNLDSYNNPGQFYAQIQRNHSIDSINSTGEFSQRMMENDLAYSLPVDMMDNWDTVGGEWKEATERTYTEDGEVYAVPNIVVVMPVIAYRDDHFDSPPNSWDIFWDEDLAGDILMWDRDYLLMQIAALYTGQDPHDPNDWDELEEVLIQQRDLNQTYYQDHDTAQQLLGNEDVVVAATPTNSALQGHATVDDSIRYTVPEEGTLYSIDQQVVPAGAPNPVAGAMLADYTMSEESAEIMWETDYAISAHEDAFDIIDRVEDNEELANLARYEDDWELQERVPLSEEVREKTADLYTEVMS